MALHMCPEMHRGGHKFWPFFEANRHLTVGYNKDNSGDFGTAPASTLVVRQHCDGAGRAGWGKILHLLGVGSNPTAPKVFWALRHPDLPAPNPIGTPIHNPPLSLP